MANCDSNRPPAVSSTQAIVDQALEFDKLAPNMIVKIPATTDRFQPWSRPYQGVSISNCVLPCRNCVAVAEAIERGEEAEREGKEIAAMGRCVRSWLAGSTIG
jgi:transaldolase